MSCSHVDQFLLISLYFFIYDCLYFPKRMSSLFFIKKKKSSCTICKSYLLVTLFIFTNLHTLFSFFSLKVTSVGINTEWGNVMASISADIVEETPLQVPYCILTFWATSFFNLHVMLTCKWHVIGTPKWSCDFN